jgi:hypothetical protein
MQNELNKVNSLYQAKLKENDQLNVSVNNMSHWEI